MLLKNTGIIVSNPGKYGDMKRMVTAKTLENLTGFIVKLGLVGLGNMIARGIKDYPKQINMEKGMELDGKIYYLEPENGKS